MNDSLNKLFTQLINNEYMEVSLSQNKEEINIIFKNTNFGVDIITPYNSIIIYFKVKHNNGWRSCRLSKKDINEVHHCNSIDDTIEYLKKLHNVIDIKSNL